MERSRQPPPQGAPPAYAIVSRVYSGSLRPIVIFMSALSALWTLLWAISEFRQISVDKSQNFPKLATISLVLGILYISACVIVIFGMVAAVTQRHALIRIYAPLFALASLVVVVAGFISVITHFVYKGDYLKECNNLTTNAVATFRWGLWGPTVSDRLTPSEAASWCSDAFNRDSWSQIVSLIVEIILGALFAATAFSYYRQSLDPSSPVNASRAPSNQIRMGAYPEHYNPPYNVPTLSYSPPPGPPPQNKFQEGYAPSYAPPSGPPPQFGKPPEYGYGSSDDDKFIGEPDIKHDSFEDVAHDPFRRS